MRKRSWLAAGLLAVAGSWSYFFPTAPRLGPLAHIMADPVPVVVFVPHGDDEVLATGGLLQELEQAGAEPRVVLVTGGDGFRLGANYFYRGRATPATMLEYGRHRLSESRKALQVLGVPEERFTFLGFPDQGLHRLWTDCWRVDRPCTSGFTQMYSVPYTEARQYGAPYAGEVLLGQVMDLLRESRPAVVVYPHPNEAHVDHWALSNFVVAALEELRRTEPDWTPPEEWLYLVHRGDWPAPKGLKPEVGLLPPEPLTRGMTQWHQRPLSPEQVAKKEAALRAYASQTSLMKRYLLSFIRSNELFGTIERVKLPPLPGAAFPAIVPPAGPPWGGMNWVEAITDPRGDTVAREVQRGADVAGVWVAHDGGNLYLAANLAARPKRPVQVRMFARGFQSGQGWGDLAAVRIAPDSRHTVTSWPADAGQENVYAEARENWVRLVLPLEALGFPESVMVNVETRLEGVLVDRTAWRPVALDGR